ERAREPEERREDESDPEEAERGDVAGAAREREVEHGQRREDEEQHRGHGLLRAKLEQQVLARERADVGEVVHAKASLSVARCSTRSGSCVATTSARAESSVSVSSRSSAPAASRALNGSSSTSSDGSWSRTRQRTRRCCMPREKVPTRSCRTSHSPNRSSSIPIRSRRSGTRYRRPKSCRFSSGVSSRYTSGSCPR